MQHPDETTLALFAGRDLGLFARWRTRRHLEHCERCRTEVAEFSALRSDVSDLSELPGISWNRLAAEMKANIHLGLAAGECVRDTRPGRLALAFSGLRGAVACVAVVVLLLAGLMIEKPPAPVLPQAERQAGVSLRVTGNGIEVRSGDNHAFVLKNGSAENVTYSAGAQGSIGARYVDRNTGYLTINTVYVQ
jgi:hypothetical protein